VKVIGLPVAPEAATVTCSAYVPGLTITWSPALMAFLAAALMVHNGALEVPGPASRHDDEVLSTHHVVPAASAIGTCTVAMPKTRAKAPKMLIRRERDMVLLP